MTMDRRAFLKLASAAPFAGVNGLARAGAAEARKLLVLVELRGGNDGLNTVIPYDDPQYARLRPRLGVARDQVVQLTERAGLHPSLEKLRALWEARELAIVQGVGYPQPNLSHFRSIEIWDTASASTEVLQQGWLARAAATSAFARFAADGVVIGAADLGPLAGGARAVSLSDPERFARQARLAKDGQVAARGALAHVLQVENDVVRAATQLRPEVTWRTEFPRGPFGTAVQHAAAIASTRKVPIIRVTLAGFDTHQNQANTQAQLLRQLGEGIVALRCALQEVAMWDNTLILTYSEFGRRPRENASAGTDHGTASPLFAFGPRVKGGRLGEAQSLARLDENGNLPFAVDFRSIYATVLSSWFLLDADRILGRRFNPLPLLKA